MGSAASAEIGVQQAGGGLQGAVGMRWRKQQVKNSQSDQKKVAALLAVIPGSSGGKKDHWYAPPLPGSDGQCTQALADAIWSFQQFWKSKGLFQVIDGTVDPGMHTWQTLVKLAKGQAPMPPQPSSGEKTLLNSQPRVPGTWQITNIWSFSLGEVGLLGAVELEITQPDGARFKLKGAGAGFGWSMDPKGLSDTINKVGGPEAPATLLALFESASRGIGFSLGDLIQKIPGAGMLTPTTTRGVIFANPVRRLIGLNQRSLSRGLLTGGGNTVFGISTGSANIVAGSETGIIVFGLGGISSAWFANAIAMYGSSGVTIKAGVGVQGMVYNGYQVDDE